ncbi:MAG: PAS domain S-box protein [Acidobacteria bacterium]|nr:PAS domain S-box protein [Acidobacteriota bacterium]
MAHSAGLRARLIVLVFMGALPLLAVTIGIQAHYIRPDHEGTWIVEAGLLLGGFLASALITDRAGRRLTAPIEALTRAAARLAGGELEARATPAGAIETVRLAEAFNAIASTLQDLETRQHRLQDQARILAAIVASSPGPMIAIDLNGRITAFNRGAEVIYGHSARDVLGRDVSMIIPPDRLPEWNMSLSTAGGSDVVREIETERLTRDGRRIPVALSVSPIHDDAGTLVGFSSIARDMRPVRTAETKATDAGFRFAQALEILPLAVAVVDQAGRIVALNRVARERYGGAIGLDAAERTREFPIYVGDSQVPCAAVERPIGRALRGEVVHMVDVGLVAAGELRPVEMWAAPLVDGQGRITHAVLIVSDRMERLQLEAQLRHAQRLDAVGHLVSGIAHDFNNLLTVIIGYADTLLAENDVPSTARELKAIYEAADRARSLTQQLLAFGRKQVLRPTPIHVDDRILAVGRMLERVLGEDIRLKLALNGADLLVNVEPIQFDQILMNVVLNARDAMPSGGTLTIETLAVEAGPVEPGSPEHRADPRPGPYLRVSVRDTGIGMEARTKARIFEPFFTTKEPGQGTGLGMATAYSIARQSGGTIAVDSEPNRGTTVHVYLPAAGKGPAGTAPSRSALARRPSSGSECVLVVEDDEHVRQFVTDVLRARGYRVLSAEGRDEAVAAIRALGRPPDLLVTDVVLRGAEGVHLAADVRQERADLPVVFISGYLDDRIGRLKADGHTVFLEKPFTSEQLATTVRTILDRRTDASARDL